MTIGRDVKGKSLSHSSIPSSTSIPIPSLVLCKPLAPIHSPGQLKVVPLDRGPSAKAKNSLKLPPGIPAVLDYTTRPPHSRNAQTQSSASALVTGYRRDDLAHGVKKPSRTNSLAVVAASQARTTVTKLVRPASIQDNRITVHNGRVCECL